MNILDSGLSTLKGWGLLKEYELNADTFAALALGIFHGMWADGFDPTVEEMERKMAQALMASAFFAQICRSIELAPTYMYPTFAQLMARHVVDLHWENLRKDLP